MFVTYIQNFLDQQDKYRNEMKAFDGYEMTIIRFPGVHVASDAVSDRDPNHRMTIGEVSFTCTSCGNHASVDFHHMIFRSIEFYCVSCGSPFRVTNPAFSGVIPKTKK